LRVEKPTGNNTVFWAQSIDHWLGYSSTEISQVKGIQDGGASTDVAYGIDLSVEPATISTDWDIQAVDTSSGGSGTSPPSSGGGGLTLLEEIIIDSGTPGFFDFTAISQDYDHLYMEGIVRSSETGSGGQWVNCWFNGVVDNGNDYYFQASGGSNGADFSGEGPGPRCWHATTSGEQANQWTQVELTIKNYTRTDVIKSFKSTSEARIAAAWADNTTVVCFHDTLTAPITQLTLQDFDNPVFAIYGELRLYGVTR
jgi:hypothetical protein